MSRTKRYIETLGPYWNSFQQEPIHEEYEEFLYYKEKEQGHSVSDKTPIKTK